MAKQKEPKAFLKPKNFKSTFKKLILSLKPYALPMIIGLVCSAISTVLAIIGPDLIKRIGTIILNSEYNQGSKITIVLDQKIDNQTKSKESKGWRIFAIK